MKTIFALSVMTVAATAVSAGVGVEAYGVSAPPMVSAGYALVPAPFRSDIFADTSSTPLGSGLNVNFSSPVSVRQIGAGWATWSHGYAGNVFYTNGQTSITMTFGPSGIPVIQFYAEPNPFGVFNITATGSDGSSSISATQPTEGSAGATGWGFYGTAGASVASVSVSSDVDFAIGEFASIPAPSPLAAIALASLISARRRR